MWFARALLWFWRITLGGAIWQLLEKTTAIRRAISATVFMRLKPDLMLAAVKKINEEVLSFNPIAIRLSAETLKQIAGLTVDEGILEHAISGPPGRDSTTAVGDAFLPILNGIFDVPAAAADMQTRTGYLGNVSNLSAFFGTNLTFQLRSLTISTISSMFGFESLRHLEGLHQTINWAFGFGWLSWAVMSTYMDTTVQPGLKRLLNSQIKPNDLSEAQALRAYIEKHLPAEALHQILDNQGVRSDIRDILIDQHTHKLSRSQIVECYLTGRISKELYQQWLTDQGVDIPAQDFSWQIGEPTLSKEQLQQLYQKGKVDRAFLVQHYRYKSYGQERAELAADLIVRARAEEIEDKITASMQKLYRDCVITETDLRQWLSTQSYTQAEQDLVIQWQQAEVRQRAFLTNHDLFKAVEIGVMDLEEVITSLQCRGYTPEDALTEAIVRLQEKAPECGSTKLEQKALIALLQKLASTWGVTPGLLKPAILKYILCLGQVPPIILPTASLKCEPMPLLGPGWIKLSWETLLATHCDLNHGIGPVPVNGSIEVKVAASRGYELVASNPLGKTTAFTWVNIEHEPPAGGA